MDVLDIQNTIKACNGDDDIGCAKGIVDTIGAFDPTGMLTIASAFIYPTCKDITKAPAPADKNEVVKVVGVDEMMGK